MGHPCYMGGPFNIRFLYSTGHFDDVHTGKKPYVRLLLTVHGTSCHMGDISIKFVM